MTRPHAPTGDVAVTLAWLFAIPCLHAQTPVYVDSRATGANNGSSWIDAYTDLQTALSAVSTGEIWVAAATYRPAAPGGSTAATFDLRSGVGLYGGFAGGESMRSQRDPRANVTVLSGDLNGDDQPGWVNRRDNVKHVVSAVSTDDTAVLDGFTVRGGYAIQAFGAGIYCYGASPTINACVITDSYSYTGGGAAMVLVGGGSPVLTHCELTDSYADQGRGAALDIARGGRVTMRDCLVARNTASTGGSLGYAGGVYCDTNSELVAERCTFDGNVATYRAGAGTYPPEGGAITNLGQITLRQCLLVGNRAVNGGGIYNLKSATLDNCVFDANAAANAGAGGGYGGGLMTALNATTTVDGCTFWQNTASEDGGGIAGNNKVTVLDSVLWGNVDTNGTIGQSQAKGVTWSHCCIENMLVGVPGEDPPDPRNFPGCIDQDPRLVDPDGPDNVAGTADDDLRLSAASPCIERGEPTARPVGLDFGGSPRLLDGDLDGVLRVDMGAHEFDHVHLDVTVRSGTVDVALSGTAGLATGFAVGLPAASGLLVGSLGELWLDPSAPIVSVPAGVVPATVSLPLPNGTFTVALQAVVASGLAGNVSNPVTLTR